MKPILIALGGALGSLARWWISEAFVLTTGLALPWAILLVNVTGCFVIGAAAAGSWNDVRFIDTDVVRYFVIVGLCGGYTTFSAFSLQTLGLLQAGDVGRALLNVAASVLGCLAATWAGYTLAAALAR
ncbi:MAG: fluoride efflux transporter CrcB [Proteobacteria bacterium]|nr:fluoride efflux transporter CrcB [Pseudomonadota bacterium]